LRLQVLLANFASRLSHLPQSRVRIASPDIANGYSSCDDLKEDIVEALKFYANSIIMSEQTNNWCVFLASFVSSYY